MTLVEDVTNDDVTDFFRGWLEETEVPDLP